ncbi:MAG TPA: hypothetical protein PLB72_04580, partial [Bacteroidia bacterium]|nr:hypothetical protein [Bacteroidia bacterium]
RPRRGRAEDRTRRRGEEDSGVVPAETVFIDDNLNNALGAQKVGMNAIHHDHAMEIEKELMAMLSAF